MSIEYTFKSSCYPIGERRVCEINSADDLFTGPAYNKIINTLSNEGVNKDNVASLWYKLSKWDKWRQVDDSGPLTSTAPNDTNRKILIKIVLKPCLCQVQEQLNNRIDELSDENRTLRQQFDGLLANLRHLQSQIDDFKLYPQGAHMELIPANHQATPIATPLADSFRKELDVAYLYAIPLVRKGTRWHRNEPIRDPIDIHKEISALEKVFTNSRKELQVTVNSGNASNLRHILGQRPKILHISCHGGYECEQGEATPYLYLEDAKQPGMMEQFNEETIKSMFSVERSPEEEVRPRVVFISACHSQRFGEIIREAGIPNVIAVNGYTQVADEAATGFAMSFYHFLLKGKTVKEAFECAKAEERYSNMSINLCCCAHRHNEDCVWEAKKNENSYEAHAMHLPFCDCRFGGNLHKPSCRWLKEIPSDMFEVTSKSSSNLKRVCCCSSDAPHEEEEKFILMSQSMEAANERIFNDVPTGDAIIAKNFVEDLVPKTHEVLIGRNIEVQQLIELLSCDPSKKIICVTGPSRVGKRLLIRTAAKYIMECVDTAKYNYENFPDGFVSIKLANTLWLLSKLNNALLPPPNIEARSLEELPKKIISQRKLVVLECEAVMESNAAELIYKLREILKEGVRIKFILVAKKRIPELDIDGELAIKEDLDMVSAYIIIKAKYPEWKTSYLKFSKTKLAQEMRTPWLIKKAAILLRDSSEDAVYERLRSEEQNSKSEYDGSIANALKIIEEKCSTLLPVYLLAQMQSGIFESMLEELAGGSGVNLDNYISEDGTLAMVTKSEVDEVDEVRYKIFDDMIAYINRTKLSLPERVSYQLLCLKALSRFSRSLIRNYNFLRYKCVNYNEFSAIIGDGIWSPIDNTYKATSLAKDPIKRFQYEKDNIIALLDPEVLPEIVKETHPNQLSNLLDYIRELTICSFTLLRCFRPNEAMNIVEVIQGFASNKNRSAYDKTSPLAYKYMELEATAFLIKGCMALSRCGQLEMAEGMKDAEKAEELFGSAKNNAGIGEAQFLQGLLLEQRNWRCDDIEKAYNCALISFCKAGCQLGEARVSLAKAILLLDNMRTEGVLELLNKSIGILKKHEYFSNMLGVCYYRRGRYHLITKNYDLAKEDLEIALEEFGHWNNCAVDKCNMSLQEVSESKERDYPLFSFLKAFPLVTKQDNGFAPLEPNVRNSSLFRDAVNDCFNRINKSVKTCLSTLTLDDLKYTMTRNCTVLHLSSNHYEDGYLIVEGKLGNLDKISLNELHKELKDSIGITNCKIVVLGIPKAEDVAQVFVDLKVPHVIYFNFSPENFYMSQNSLTDLILKKESMYKFSIEFYANILKGLTVYEAWKSAKELMINYVKERCESLKIKGFNYEDNAGPILLPLGNHDVQVLTKLQNGNFIDMTPKRAQCDIEKDRRPFIGRQVEMYNIAKELYEKHCINLYGECGVGKTRLAKEVGYFLFIRILFKSYICYFDCSSNGKAFKAVLDTKLQYSKTDSSDLPILVILDNISCEVWQRERHNFRSLKNDHNCVFLLISQRPLESTETGFFPMINYELKPFENVELSLDLMFAMIDTMKDFPISSLLHVENGSNNELRSAMSNLKGFKQTNGYPRLVKIFYKKIIEANQSHYDIATIDMLRDKSIKSKYKKFLRHISKGRASEVLLYAGLAGQNKTLDKSMSFVVTKNDKIGHSKLPRNIRKVRINPQSFICPFNDAAARAEGAHKETERHISTNRNSFIGKSLFKLEKPRDISPIEDLSNDSSGSASEDSRYNVSNVSSRYVSPKRNSRYNSPVRDKLDQQIAKSFSLVIVEDENSKVSEEETKEEFNVMNYRYRSSTMVKPIFGVMNTEEESKVKRRLSPKKRPSKVAKEVRKSEKVRRVQRRSSGKLNSSKKWTRQSKLVNVEVNTETNVEEGLDTIVSESDSESSQ